MRSSQLLPDCQLVLVRLADSAHRQYGVQQHVPGDGDVCPAELILLVAVRAAKASGQPVAWIGWRVEPDGADRYRLNLDLGPEFDDLPCRHPEKGGRALGISLKEREHGLPSDPHARDIFTGNDGFAADIISDVVEIDARQFALIAGEL